MKLNIWYAIEGISGSACCKVDMDNLNFSTAQEVVLDYLKREAPLTYARMSGRKDGLKVRIILIDFAHTPD